MAKYTKIDTGYMGQLVEWTEVVTEGKDLEECRQMLRDATQEMVLAYQQQHKEIPLGNSLIEQENIIEIYQSRKLEVHCMSQPKFQEMSQKELRDYTLSHRDDQEAFYAYIDRLHQEGNWIEMPPVDSVEDLERYPEFTARFRQNSQP